MAGSRSRCATTGEGPANPRLNAGLGISGMTSRVEALGGTLEAGPVAGGGFEVHAVVPAAAGEEVTS